MAEALGGKILTPRSEIPGMGWYGLFSDPTGNLVGLFTDTSHKG
jgi:predicted enzyme related to lactoylglutathione lyase